VKTTRRTKPVVHVWECSRCGLEYFSLQGSKPVTKCGRCHNTFLPVRVIPNPHQQTIDQAMREDARRATPPTA
jgi:DNA-directed RNA polymerase subunit RPC12/RpoP